VPTRLKSVQIIEFIDVSGEPGALRFRIVTTGGRAFPAVHERLREFQIDDAARERLYASLSEKSPFREDSLSGETSSFR
jgi:predicted RNA binding protein with dsRBD fold (UPF0201 family)